jgi:FtsP/CotA-like multicopper oxidase with cupredoxin domain
LRDGVLTIHLEIARGLWHPEDENGVALAVYSFGETGRPPQNPGPLIRVAQGTTIAASVHNSGDKVLAVHGLCTRPCDKSSDFNLTPGETREVRFQASAAGLFYYWAGTPGATLRSRDQSETQLNGALAVDAPGKRADAEIFIISVMADGPAALSDHLIATINGKSWPFTRRFQPRIGEPVRWRWINTSEEAHAMHLHGFYYRVEAVGDGNSEHVYEGDARLQVVTHRIDPGDTFEMTWSPERAGRWLFHCHMVVHMVPPNYPAVAIKPAVAKQGAGEHAMHDSAGMGQLVLGIDVPGNTAAAAPAWKAARRLKLEIANNERPSPRYRIDLRDPAQQGRVNHAALIGPPIVLTRGEPVEVEVVNHIAAPTAIHWHGIELESYYDGVPNWTGLGTEITPAIAPGKSFVARMAPPRAGTFIYHTHWHDEIQLKNGIYGALLVVPPGEKFDPASDLVFVLSLGEFVPFGDMLLINGSPQNNPLRLTAGKRYRMRLINIAPNNVAMQVFLRQTAGLARWRLIAKDGADIAPETVKSAPAEMQITVGETYDVEFESPTAQELLFDVYLPGPKIHTTQTLVFAPAAR